MSSKVVQIPKRQLIVLGGFAIILAFVLGVTAGWALDGNMTAAWFSAAGTWVGAVGTVGTIAWAVMTFAHQESTRRADERLRLSEKEREDLDLAELVVVGSSAASVAGKVEQVSSSVSNGTDRTIKIQAVELLAPQDAVYDTPHFRPRSLVPNQTVNTGIFRVSEGGGEQDPKFDAAVTFEISGVKWRRTSEGSPQRLQQ